MEDVEEEEVWYTGSVKYRIEFDLKREYVVDDMAISSLSIRRRGRMVSAQ